MNHPCFETRNQIRASLRATAFFSLLPTYFGVVSPFSVIELFIWGPSWAGEHYYHVSLSNWDSRCLLMHLWKMPEAQSLHQDTRMGKDTREIESYR